MGLPLRGTAQRIFTLGHNMGISKNILLFVALWILLVACILVALLAGRPLIRSYLQRQPEGYFHEASRFLEEGRHVEATEVLREALAKNPYDFEAQFLLAEVMHDSGDKEGAYAHLGGLESLSYAAAFRRGPVIGYDTGKFYYQMAMWDFAEGRIEQGVHHLLRVVDESPIYISNPPDGLPSVASLLSRRLETARSNEEILLYCRVLDAMGRKSEARGILKQIGSAEPGKLPEIQILETEMDLLGLWFAPDDEALLAGIRASRRRIDELLGGSFADPIIGLSSRLLLGHDNTPARPLVDSELLPLLGNQAVLIQKPGDFHFVTSLTLSQMPAESGLSFNIYGPGKAVGELELPRPARSLCVIARGSNAMAVWPYVVIRLDGREIGRRYLRHYAYRPYVLPVEADAGKHRIEVEFLNDEFDKIYRTDTNVYLRALVWMP